MANIFGKNPTTVRISINIATGNCWEGDGELVISMLDASQLTKMDINQYKAELNKALEVAIAAYAENNRVGGHKVSPRPIEIEAKGQKNFRFNGCPIEWDGEGYYGQSDSTGWFGKLAGGKKEAEQAKNVGIRGVTFIRKSDLR